MENKEQNISKNSNSIIELQDLGDLNDDIYKENQPTYIENNKDKGVPDLKIEPEITERIGYVPKESEPDEENASLKSKENQDNEEINSSKRNLNRSKEENLSKNKDNEVDVKIEIKNKTKSDDNFGYEKVELNDKSLINKLKDDKLVINTNKNTDLNAPPQTQNEEQKLGKIILDVDKGFLVNEKEYDGLGNDNIQDPEILNRLIEEVEMQHPMKKFPDGTMSRYSVCGSETGNMGCGFKESKSDFESMGIGILFYFKILKIFTIIFFVIVILNIPLYYVYTTNHPEFRVQTYKEAFFKTTIGNVGSSLKNCQKISANDIFKKNKLTFNLDCKTYNISSVISFGMTSNYNYTIENAMYCQNFTTYVNITTDSECSFENYLNTYVSKSCLGSQACNITVDLKEIQANCTIPYTYDDFYFVYDCYDGWILGEDEISRSDFSFVVILIDVGSMAILLIVLIIVPMAQQRTNKFFKENVIEISDYTIHFTHLNLNQNNIHEELNRFLNHVYYISILEKDEIEDEKETQNDINIIYEVNYPVLTDRKLDLILFKIKLTERLNNLKADLALPNKSQTKKQELDKKLDELRAKDSKLREDIMNANNVDFEHVDDVYVTFTNQRVRNRIFSGLNRGCCSRCCLIFCCQKNKIRHLYFNDKWTNVEQTTDQPSNIRWQNIPYSKCRRMIRKTFVFFIAVIVILASFGIVIGTKYAESEIEAIFNSNVDCSFVEYTNQSVMKEFNDENLNARSKVKSYCFCLDTLYTSGFTNTKVITLDGKTKICDSWLEMYIYSQSLMVGTFILVPIINIVLSILLGFLTEMERNKSVSINATSKMWKAFLFQLINTAIVILVVNIYIKTVKDWNSSFPLFTGLFTDFDPRWFQSVGVTIIFCMILNIITPHITQLFVYIWWTCKKSCDRGCSGKMSKTKLNTRNEFIELYMGPQFDLGLRYSEILTTIFVTLTYSSGMPILYVSCFVFLFITYWVDKCLILRFYRSPPHIDLYISNLFNIIILFGVVVHYCFGIWTYGNKTILTDNAQSSVKQVSDWIRNLLGFVEDSLTKEIVDRLTYSYNIICLVFVIFVFLIFMFRVFLMDFVMKYICCCCTQNLRKVKSTNIYDAIRVKGLYANHQLRKAQYFKIKNSNEKCSTLKEKYFLKMLQVDRENILRRFREVTKIPIPHVNVSNFDDFMPDLIKKEKIMEVAPIHSDISYNITYIPQFRDVAYFEFIVPFLNKDKK